MRCLAKRAYLFAAMANPSIPRFTPFRSLFLAPLVAGSLLLAIGCDKEKGEKPKGGDVPPPVPSAPASASQGPSACASGGGTVGDSVSAAFFPRVAGGYCVDPQGEVKTYGEKGKFSMDEVCTTAFDGECEVYKRFGLKRVVSLHYVDGSGKGGTVEINVSQFADMPGAYGMFTMRVVAGDPADPSSPRTLAAGGGGAIGTGRAYVWRGQHLVELQYNNETESPEQLAKSSEAILSTLGKDIGSKLPGSTDAPKSAMALPRMGLLPNGIVYSPKDVLGVSNLGAGAQGFYKEGEKRYRALAIAKDDGDQAKDVMKTLRGRAGAMPVKDLGDEAVEVVVSSSPTSPKLSFVVARKGSSVFGVGDEEYAVRGAGGGEKEKAARLSKDDAVSHLKAWLTALPEAPKK